MAKWKPFVMYMTAESYRDYCNNQRKSMYITQEFNTYRELKKNLKEICEQHTGADGVSVSRSRRNEWGEWFERWELDSNGKPHITDQGWM